ncbi:MAG: hypothetical protein J6J55_00655 [Paludibacteraceae bacterium]|nr:hypothetical protein [Paludibacteraceae bacterium]MBP3574983.1 hypothetical protein [Paludibacteraceae bacterium]
MLTTILALVVSAAIDSTTLFIGDQTDLHLRATCEVGEQVQLPVLSEELIPGIEIVDKTIIDTAMLNDGRAQYNQYVTLTSFEDSLFYIAPLPFVSGDDTVWSESLTLNVVQPFEMDSTDMAITDIKGIYKAPIWWWGILRWVLLALAIAGIGVGGYYLITYLQSRARKSEDEVLPAEPLRPAEEVALEKLDAIREQKIWQTGQVKEYHTQLTDVVREYIARRFDVSSVEQTSDETLRAMRGLLSDKKELYESLREMLTLADLVKFAKWTATPDENEKSLRSAYTFVKETTPVNEPTEN